MRYHKHYKLIISMILASIMLLTACGDGDLQQTDSTAQNTQSVSNQAGELKTYPIPTENRNGRSTLYPCSATAANGYYRASNNTKTVSYCDVESGKRMILCSQSGCTHSDESCQAWIGNVSTFTEYQGNIYAGRLNEDGSADFVKKDLSTGEIEIIDAWRPKEENSYYDSISIGNFAYNRAIVRLEWRKSYWQEETLIGESEIFYYIYDLVSGERRQLFPDEDSETITTYLLSPDHMLALYSPSAEDLGFLDYNEYCDLYGSEDGYIEYSQQVDEAGVNNRELRLYDIDTFEYEVIASAKDDGLILSGDPNMDYGNLFIYQCRDTLYVFDIMTGESTEYFTAKDITNSWITDHKVFYIVQPEGENIEIYYADLDDKIPVKLENNGNPDVMEFGIIFEGNGFYTAYGGGEWYLSKEDFYAEKYENKKAIF